MPKIIATKNDWVEAGLKKFSETGPDGLIVERLAKEINVNKSSFYWHFKTKKDYIDDIISLWIKRSTQDIIDSVEAESNAVLKFEKLIELCFNKKPYIDFFFHLKKYGSERPDVKKLLDEIDAIRIAFTENLLSEMGFNNVESRIKARVFYKYLLGHHEMSRYKVSDFKDIIKAREEIQTFIDY
ncbi:TetR/AcrR family transcriptional regulator [Maribacter sp. 2307ULW6-5]|uniref:TetR/AcrR family transcriptional regulator n=1 Tax=Maribacter sp. 2307ULW6-5 TaxID=3386275 RepID=UPI0039BCBA33